MINRTATIVRSLSAASFIAASMPGASLAAADTVLKKDMTSVIALQGLPCGQVVAVKTNADNDYSCTCADGTRYRVHVGAGGRVVVEKQK